MRLTAKNHVDLLRVVKLKTLNSTDIKKTERKFTEVTKTDWNTEERWVEFRITNEKAGIDKLLMCRQEGNREYNCQYQN